MQPAARRKRFNDRFPIERDIHRHEEEIQCTGNLIHLRRVARVDDVMRAEPFGFLALRVARRKRKDFAAPPREKAKSHVAQPADADNPNAVGRFHVRLENGVENRDAAAEEGAGFGRVKFFRQRDGPRPLGADAIGKAAVTPDDGSLAGGAEVLVAGQALLARQATAGSPTDADPLAQTQLLCL